MRILKLALLLSLLVVSASGQKTSSTAGTPKLEIIKSDWSIAVNNPLLEEDPLQVLDDVKQAQRDAVETQRQNQVRIQQGLPIQPTPNRKSSIEAKPAAGVSTTYIYELKVKNTGTKEIDAITWDYIFYERDTDKEIGRRQFESKISIEPGKTKNITIRSSSPPTGTINAKNTGKKMRDQYSEQIFIQTILYADGSVWQTESK